MDYKIFKSGTDIRGVASEGVEDQPVNLTDEVIMRMADGFLLWCENRLQKKASELKIALGHDSRISADRIAKALTAAFSSRGAATVDCGLSSTPSMFMAVLELHCDASVQITASHHPFHRNGLKFFTRDGGLDGPDISFILDKAQQGEHPKPTAPGAVIQKNYMERYAVNLCALIKNSVKAEDFDHPLKGFRLVVDAGNGAGGFYATEVLQKLGADITGSQFLEPNGHFPNHIPNPEDKTAMESISAATVAAGADLGIIFDTDVDRGGAVGPDGREINRNTLVAVAAAIALEGNPGGTIVTDSITSDGLKDYIETTLGGVHHRFQRGYKNVINEAIRLNGAGINCPLAIETSGHAAMRENYFLDDGAYLVTKLIIKLAKLRMEGKDLSMLLAPLKMAEEELELRFPILAEDFRPVGNQVIADLEHYAREQGWSIAPDNREGIRISFDKDGGDGWLLLRMSVHDPIMPLNLESNRVGGVRKIAGKLLEFFSSKQYEKLDIRPLTNYVN